MSKLVCHMGKYTRSNVGGMQRHNQRENKNYGNENIDVSKINLNYDLANENKIKYLEKIDNIINEKRTSTKAVRKDAVVFVDTIVGSDKEFFNKLSPGETKRFFEQSYEYLKNKVGEDNVISAVVHMDETLGVGGSPHMHFSFVPMNDDGTLSAKKKINRNFLREIQDEFPKYMKNQGFDIERGLEKSKAQHLEPLEFKKKQIEEEYNKLQNKYMGIKNVSEELSKVEEQNSSLLDKLDKIEVKKGFLSDKLTISEQDYSTLVSLAKSGQAKSFENLKLKSKVGELQRKLDKSNYDEEITKDKLKRLGEVEGKYLDLQRKYIKINKTLERVEGALNKLDLVDKVNDEIKAQRLKEQKRIKSFDRER
ncbi:MAG: MobV family relaxase [bacterium]|nr:MobV family relaxase [bacterium]